MVRFSITKRGAQARGFTLVELMIVVAVIAILTALSVYGVRKYILHSRTSEAVEMLGAIRAAQEVYKGDTFQYRATVGDGPAGKSLATGPTNYPGFYPKTTVPKREKMSWGATDVAGAGVRWRELGVSTTAPVQYIYGCAAGTGADAPAGLGDLATDPGVPGYPTVADGKPWYLCKAAADLDNDGRTGEWAYSSHADEIIHPKADKD